MKTTNAWERDEGMRVWYLLVFALLQFPLRFSGSTFVTYIFIYLLPGLYLLYHYKWCIDFLFRVVAKKGWPRIAVIVLCVIFIESCIWPIVHQTFDFSFLTDWWFKLVLLIVKNLFLVALYENHVAKSKLDICEYMYYFLYAVVLYVMLSLVLIMIPPLREFCITHLYMIPKELVDIRIPSYFTRLGWSGWAGYDVSMQCSVAVMFACILIVVQKGNIQKQMITLGLSVVALLGNMFYARTGMIVSLVLLFVTAVYSLIRKDYIFVKWIAIIGGAGVVAVMIAAAFVPALNDWTNWAFSIFVNFFTQGKLNDNIGSTGHLINDMYWIPQLKTILVGDGWFTQDGSYYMYTDSGIMRLTLYYGAINFFAGAAAGFVLIQRIAKRVYDQGLIDGKDKVFITVLILILMILFEAKGEAYYKIMCIVFPIAFIGLKAEAPQFLNKLSWKSGKFLSRIKLRARKGDGI